MSEAIQTEIVLDFLGTTKHSCTLPLMHVSYVRLTFQILCWVLCRLVLELTNVLKSIPTHQMSKITPQNAFESPSDHFKKHFIYFVIENELRC